jgi:hypothetical protein
LICRNAAAGILFRLSVLQSSLSPNLAMQESWGVLLDRLEQVK